MKSDTLLGVQEVADHLDIKATTVHDYHKKGVMPPADKYFGRSPVWMLETIDEWDSQRPTKNRENG